MIHPDLTEVLTHYRDWDDLVKERYLAYAESLMKQHTQVVYKGIEYHHIEDLKVDLEAKCEQEKK